MRILHLITKLELGGAQANTLFTCRRLAERGHDVLLAHGPGGLLDAEAAAAPFRREVVRPLVRAVSPLRDAAALAALWRLLRRERPDVLHTHSSKAGVLGRIAGRIAGPVTGRRGAPVLVHSVHGWSFSPHHPPMQRLAYRAAERLLGPLTDHFISVSRRDLETGVRAGIVRQGRGSVIRSGIDLAAFAADGPGRAELRAQWRVADGHVLVVQVGPFKPQKAPLDFVRAAGAAAALEESLRFAMVGDGELRSEVEREVERQGLAGRMVLAGWRRDVAEVLRASDVVALTSLWEGLPRTVVEARAVGRPVVATPVNGTPEAIEDGVHGLLIPPHDVAGFAAAFVRLARDAALRRRLGERRLEDLAEFDREVMVARQEALYERLLAALK